MIGCGLRRHLKLVDERPYWGFEITLSMDP